MAAPAATAHELETKVRPVFARMRDIFQDIRQSSFGSPDFNVLSMGMSGDFEVAISEGSTEVRVGSALFGPRG